MASPRLALSMLALVVTLTVPLRLAVTAADDPSARHARAEAIRLRAHFDSVDAELRQAVLTLTPSQRTSRETLIGWLREYRDAGTFPLNDRYPDRAMPFFRDSRGVLCAMAYLIDRSGRGDLVDRVAATRNSATIAELADDPALLAWLDSTGLTLAEAGRIQPFYGPPPLPPEEAGVSGGYAITSILVSGTSMATIAVNAFAPSKSAGWAGVLAGGAALVAGVAQLNETHATKDVAIANTLIGGGALTVGLYTALRPPKRASPDRTEPAAPGAPGDITISPMVVPAAGGPRFGLAMHTTF
jgi:hypothetical protein